ncbi:a243e183-13d4-492a-b867-71630582f329 [Sclerotinia trifoliorum]|uniref:A243e183-13d4-492a-b867-71630582f329 n=1 Tax=Sclerotinia trifoliorum TaxID=28548 RepID=A0A8H2W4G1_9HELO|nr:a243e183-13d4-492a-b867-71630582f329 [Sclerotinia trifoliorum]
MPPRNFILYDCGHREFENPSPLKKLKRALSIRKVLSNKVKEAKDIRADGVCPECAKDPVGLLLGDQVFRRINNPLQPVGLREEYSPSHSDETEAESQQERSSSEEESAHEEEVEARKDHGVVERPPTRIPRRPVGAPPAQSHRRLALFYPEEDPFADGKDPLADGEHAFTDGYREVETGRRVSVYKEEGDAKGVSEDDDSARKSDEQRKNESAITGF